MPNEDWDRLAQAVTDRMTVLDIKQTEIPGRGGPSPAKVREITNRRTTTLSASKRRDLERALEWQLGSIDAILAGGDPTPLPDVRDFDDALVRARMKLSALNHRRSQKPEEWTDDDDRLRDHLDHEVAALLDKRALAAFVADRSKADSHRRWLIDLWVRAQPLTQPGRLDADELTDSAVELARQVSAYTESQVGGYTKMQILAQAAREADDRAVGQQTIFEETENDLEAEATAGTQTEARPPEEVKLNEPQARGASEWGLYGSARREEPGETQSG